MILDWFAHTPVLLTAVAVVFLPGLAALRLVGMRGLALLAAAPVFSIAATALIAVGFGLVGVPWTPLSWAAAMTGLVALAWALGRLLGTRLGVEAIASERRILPAAVLVGAVIGAVRLASYIADPAGISQTNDAVFHMNAVRYIAETANASSMHISGVVGGQGFYPGAWHGAVSLIIEITGTSIPVAANMLTLVIGALIWPLGLTWLVLRATASTQIAAYAAVLSGALQTFPLLMFQWGVLFPNALSIALIPAAVAMVMSLPVWSAGSARLAALVRAALLVLIAVTALAFAQPAALLPWAAISAVWLTFWLLAERTRIGAIAATAVIAAVWVSLAAVWLFMAQSTTGSHWPPFRGKREVLLDVLLNGQVLIPSAIAVSLLMLYGLVVAVRTRSYRWLVVCWGGVSMLYILVAAVGNDVVRGVILAPWYADPYRIAALAPLVVIPLAAVGLDGLVRTIRRVLPGAPSERRMHVIALAASAALMILLVLLRPVAMPKFLERTYDDESRYSMSSTSYLSVDERALLESLGELVEPGARVLGNPSTGTGFGFMFSGVDVYPRNWSQPRSGQWDVLAEGLRDAAEDPAVCEALAAYDHPGYVLDFGLGEQGPGRYELPGMTDFEGQQGFDFVAQEGDASLWRITACAQ